jgi:PAS domain S-box-containing protein
MKSAAAVFSSVLQATKSFALGALGRRGNQAVLKSQADAPESEKHLRDLLESLHAIVWEAEAKTLQFRFVSRRAEEILGYPVERWLKGPDFLVNHLHPDDREKVSAQFRGAAKAEADRTLTYRMLAADGRMVSMWSTLRGVRDADGAIRSLRGLMLDITELRAAEEEKIRLTTAIEQSAEAVVITDIKGTIQYVNPAFSQITGYSREEVLGQNVRILKSGEQDASFYQGLWGTILKGQIWHGELVNRRKDGSLYTQEMNIAPVRNERGEITHFIATQQDVTARKGLELQLWQAQKMEAVGRLAGGVAHDFNNLLTIINGYSQLIVEGLEPNSTLKPLATEVQKAGERAAGLTRQLLAFSRRQVLAPEILDLNVVITNIEKMLRRLLGEDIEFRTLCDPALWHVRADRGQVEQILMNLVVNARDAMPQGGRLTIETSNAQLDAAYPRSHAHVIPGHYALLLISDTGIGMDSVTQARIFEPFFSTKEHGKGTGLGLATVYGIVKQSGGYIWVYSEPGRGTTFKVYFPRVEGEAEPRRPTPAQAESRPCTETILVVEDEPAVREFAARVLQSNGYKVLVASNPEEAVGVSDQYKETIHLLLTDVVMPMLSGRQLVDHLAFSRPEMKVLYMSGYSDDTIVHRGVTREGAAFLEKPFTPKGLLRRVREVLARSPDG